MLKVLGSNPPVENHSCGIGFEPPPPNFYVIFALNILTIDSDCSFPFFQHSNLNRPIWVVLLHSSWTKHHLTFSYLFYFLAFITFRRSDLRLAANFNPLFRCVDSVLIVFELQAEKEKRVKLSSCRELAFRREINLRGLKIWQVVIFGNFWAMTKCNFVVD